MSSITLGTVIASIDVIDDSGSTPSVPESDEKMDTPQPTEAESPSLTPIKHTYECMSHGRVVLRQTHETALDLKIVKEIKQTLPHEEPSCMFEIVTTVVADYKSVREVDLDTASIQDLKIQSIESSKMIINSPYLLDAIREVVKYYPNQNLIGEAVIIHEPYMVLIHHFDELTKLKARLEDPATAEKEDSTEEKCRHLHVLLEFLSEKMQHSVNAAHKRLKNTSTVLFADIWYLLKPGTLSYFRYNDIWLGGVIEGVLHRDKDEDDDDGKKEAWIVSMIFQDTNFPTNLTGRASVSIEIEIFDGEMVVTRLPVVPRDYHDSQDNGQRKASFEKRGALVADIMESGYKLKKYNGPFQDAKKQAYQGHIIAGSSEQDVDFPNHDWDFSWHRAPSGDGEVEEAPDLVLPIHRTPGREAKPLLSTDHLFMMCPILAAFALSSKTWEIVHIDYTSDMDTPDTIPEANIDPEDLKMIKALSDRQIKSKVPWSADFIKNKGEGVVVLLHGPPGVGKTYTVETVAINTGRPLISLTIADLGTKESTIESELTKWFALAQRWRAVLLIDEADVFLERREHKDIARNGIVSAFLRKIEYFSGLLFLTTNRVGHIDEAFISRVHVIIGFKKLDPAMRKKIWKSFLDKLSTERKHQIRVTPAGKQYILGEEMGKMDWNGREIRNAFQTAIALAEYDQRESDDYQEGEEIMVEASHFQRVMAMSRSFKDYLDTIRKDDEDIRATRHYGRNDTWDKEHSAPTVKS
ncbi:P-loop containing nucleoside triphosphate hydrolase protein [Aspergillus crustosus]